MEAKDLMVGDLVYNHRNWACPIVEIHKDSAVVIARHYGEEKFELKDLRPIPLTQEILEKNGWVKNLYSAESYDNEELECLSLWVGEDGKNKWWWHVGVELVTPINYVHELQHALRLCEIEKEIEL